MQKLRLSVASLLFMACGVFSCSEETITPLQDGTLPIPKTGQGSVTASNGARGEQTDDGTLPIPGGREVSNVTLPIIVQHDGTLPIPRQNDGTLPIPRQFDGTLPIPRK